MALIQTYYTFLFLVKWGEGTHDSLIYAVHHTVEIKIKAKLIIKFS